jgi:uncharacterized linocin/CFP29 family protein
VITVPGEILDALAREYDVAAKVGLTTKVKTHKSIAIVDFMVRIVLNIKELNNIKRMSYLQIESQIIYQ